MVCFWGPVMTPSPHVVSVFGSLGNEEHVDNFFSFSGWVIPKNIFHHRE